jgi:hypothetical protein
MLVALQPPKPATLAANSVVREAVFSAAGARLSTISTARWRGTLSIQNFGLLKRLATLDRQALLTILPAPWFGLCCFEIGNPWDWAKFVRSYLIYTLEHHVRSR